MREPTLVELEAPVKIVGDIHGQFHDMHRLFDIIGRVPEQKLLFLGGKYLLFFNITLVQKEYLLFNGINPPSPIIP